MASSNGLFTNWQFLLLFSSMLSLHWLYGVYAFSHGLWSTTDGVRHVEILQFQNTWLQRLLKRLCFRTLKLQKREDGWIQQIKLYTWTERSNTTFTWKIFYQSAFDKIKTKTYQNRLFSLASLPLAGKLIGRHFAATGILFSLVSKEGKVCVNKLG